MRIHLILLFLIVNNIAYSCECGVKPEIDTAIKNAEFIIVGKIIKKDVVRIIRDPFSGMVINPEKKKVDDSPFGSYINRYAVAVEFYYKGVKIKKIISLYTEATAGLCGYPFQIGNRYIIYGFKFGAKNKKNREQLIFYTDICNRTNAYSEKEIEELNKRLKAHEIK